MFVCNSVTRWRNTQSFGLFCTFWWKSGGGRRRSFTYLSMCEKKLLFFLRVLSMYLTSYDLHLPVFRAFLHFLVEVGWRSMEVICKPFYVREKLLYYSTIFCFAREGKTNKNRRKRLWKMTVDFLVHTMYTIISGAQKVR